MRGLVFRLLLSLEPQGRREYAFLRKYEDADTIRAVGRERLAALLRHCRRKVAYYQRILGELGVPEGAEIDAFPRMPLLTRAIIRAQASELRADDADVRAAFQNHTGGSTGEPLTFLSDPGDTRRSGGALLRFAYSWYGLKPGDREVKLWGSEQDLFRGKLEVKERILNKFRGYLLLNAFRMTPQDMRRHLEAIARFRPRVIRGYCHNLYELARFAENHGIVIPSPRLVVSSAGTLHPPLRELMERVYGAKVCNHYGSREVHTVAWECPEQSRLHLCPLTHLVEIVDRDGSPCPPGVEGDLVVTSLTNYSMPFIRYRIGDRAAFAAEPCPCGRSFPVLARLFGRSSECFFREDGTVVPGEYFIHLLGVVLNDGVFRKLQVVQEEYDRVVIRCVMEPAKQLPAVLRSEIIEKVKLVMGADCSVELRPVADIPSPPSGKYQYTISKVAPR